MYVSAYLSTSLSACLSIFLCMYTYTPFLTTYVCARSRRKLNGRNLALWNAQLAYNVWDIRLDIIDSKLFASLDMFSSSGTGKTNVVLRLFCTPQYKYDGSKSESFQSMFVGRLCFFKLVYWICNAIYPRQGLQNSDCTNSRSRWTVSETIARLRLN